MTDSLKQCYRGYFLYHKNIVHEIRQSRIILAYDSRFHLPSLRPKKVCTQHSTSFPFIVNSDFLLCKSTHVQCHESPEGKKIHFFSKSFFALSETTTNPLAFPALRVSSNHCILQDIEATGSICICLSMAITLLLPGQLFHFKGLGKFISWNTLNSLII